MYAAACSRESPRGGRFVGKMFSRCGTHSTSGCRKRDAKVSRAKFFDCALQLGRGAQLVELARERLRFERRNRYRFAPRPICRKELVDSDTGATLCRLGALGDEPDQSFRPALLDVAWRRAQAGQVASRPDMSGRVWPWRDMQDLDTTLRVGSRAGRDARILPGQDVQHGPIANPLLIG
jgi:hypothetical protein